MKTTLDRILANCEEFGECLLWKGVMANSNPQLWVRATEQDPRNYVPARRLVYEATKGMPIRSGYFPVMKCREPRCLNPAHIVILTRSQIGLLATKEGKYGTPARRAAISKARRQDTRSKLTLALANEIRVSTDTGPVLAERYGIDKSLVNRIKRGEVWRNGVANSSAFNMAAAA